MRTLGIALLIIMVSFSALADGGRAFPPDNCTSGNPFMAFDGVATGGNTYCINGQSVLNNALPGCTPNQQVIFNGTSFVCQDSTSDLDLPTCGAGQFLTSDGAGFSCSSTSVPTCAANYVLTYNGSAFTCVPRSASVPTCAANQFLTYNGTSFQCAATQQLTLPSCGAGQVLTSNGGTPACVAAGGSGASGSWCGFRYVQCNGYTATYDAYQSYYISPSPHLYAANAPCNGITLTTSCGNGVMLPANNCPSGYTGAVLRGVSASQVCTSDCGGPQPGPTYYYLTCVKN